MFCSKCGSENPDNGEFCWKCGQQLYHGEQKKSYNSFNYGGNQNGGKLSAVTLLYIVIGILLVFRMIIVQGVVVPKFMDKLETESSKYMSNSYDNDLSAWVHNENYPDEYVENPVEFKNEVREEFLDDEGKAGYAPLIAYGLAVLICVALLIDRYVHGGFIWGGFIMFLVVNLVGIALDCYLLGHYFDFLDGSTNITFGGYSDLSLEGYKTMEESSFIFMIIALVATIAAYILVNKKTKWINNTKKKNIQSF